LPWVKLKTRAWITWCISLGVRSSPVRLGDRWKEMKSERWPKRIVMAGWGLLDCGLVLVFSELLGYEDALDAGDDLSRALLQDFCRDQLQTLVGVQFYVINSGERKCWVKMLRARRKWCNKTNWKVRVE